MNSTIVAISTPPGRGGIAVIRLSGSDAFTIAARHVKLPSEGQTTRFTPFRVDDTLVDEVVVTPHSYTGLDTVEFSCHGSLFVQQSLLQALLDSGARLAEPGEFTRQAFLSGRLNLSQAEAVADLIDSTNAASHRLAVSQLRGGYAQTLDQLRQKLVDLTSLLELELDFSDEDVEFADRGQLRTLVTELQTSVSRLVNSFSLGNAIKRGIPVAIVGRPNVGKSSLLNALLADDRAIVSPIPGTTRDTIEETLTLDGLAFRFIDTAGLRQSDDPIEAIGLERAIKSVREATVILFVRDASEPSEESFLEEVKHHLEGILQEDKIMFVVHNKADLVRKRMDNTEGVMLTNLRHCEALRRVSAALNEVSKGLDANTPADLVAIDLRDALHHLGTITGQVTSDEILGTIFSRFCIGK